MQKILDIAQRQRQRVQSLAARRVIFGQVASQWNGDRGHRPVAWRCIPGWRAFVALDAQRHRDAKISCMFPVRTR